MIPSTHNDSNSGRIFRLPLVSLVALAALLAISPSARGQDKQSPTAQLVQRIEQLEEQIVDLQVVIGTLQSLPRGAPSVPAAGATSTNGASDGARLDGMETQIRALTAQLAQLAQQVRNMNAGAPGPRGAIGGPNSHAATRPNLPSASPAQQTGAISGFGSTTVQPTDTAVKDPIGGYLQAPGNGERALAPPSTTAALDRSDPKKLYETAYGYLLQQQYGAAQTAFSEFVTTYPNDSLTGNAQYWLGETFFLRKQYKSAASAFLKGYESYATSSKASDSLLKLAMSLDRLGHKDAACSSLSELTSRFPAAPAHVKRRAASERKRIGC